MGQSSANNTTKDFYLFDVTAGATRLYVATTGNVGIGTAEPGERFSVVSADNTAGTNIARFLAQNLSQSIGIGYQDVRQVAAGIPININAGTSGVVRIGNASTGGVLLAGGGGNVGIGTAGTNGKLSIANNVATGFLNTYGEYQVLLYDTGAATTSYGLGIKANTLVFNSGGGGYSFDRAGAATPLAIDTAGLITVANRITGVSTPTASSDAATKGYVDSVVGAQYIGRTVTTYTGNLGGIAGANAKCNAVGGTYAGSHMCTQGEALRSGATSFGGAGWIACDLVNGEETCLGVTYSITNSTASGYATCIQWTGTSSSQWGPQMSSTGNVTEQTCNNSLSIHCCK
jgi:hypothetical protein